MTKRALVLSGGGARGAYQVGMLEELVGRQRLDFQIIRAVSVGALNAAYLAQAPAAGDSQTNLGTAVERLSRLWREKIRGDQSVYEQRMAGVVGLAAGADSIYSLAPLRGLLETELDLAALRASGRDFAVGYTSLLDGEYRETSASDPKFVDKLLASAAIPVVFPYVDLDRDVLVDGGVRNMTPLASAFTGTPDEIYVLLSSRLVFEGNQLPSSAVQRQGYEQKWRDGMLGTRVGGIDVLRRTLDILTDEIYLEDIRSALAWNRILVEIDAQRAAAPGNAEVARALDAVASAPRLAGKRRVELHVLAPQEWYGEENAATDFAPALVERALEHGREVAANAALWLRG